MSADQWSRSPGVRLGAGAEFRLIENLARGSSTEKQDFPDDRILVGPGDDCAVIAPDLVVTSDLSVEDVHFRRSWISLREVGYRAGVSSLSDLAAMAARPIGVTVAMALPADGLREMAIEIQAGVRDACEPAGARVVGGDLSRSPGPIFVEVGGLGRAPEPVLRSGALPGDELWVTGRLGGGAGAVAAWAEGRRPTPGLRAAFTTPPTRIREALWLKEEGLLHAMIDLSDGLAGDVSHIAVASGVGIALVKDWVPVHAELEADSSPAFLAMSGGEDYELCFAAPLDRVAQVKNRFESELGVELTRVGWVEEGEGVWLSSPDGTAKRPLTLHGFDHLRTGSNRGVGEGAE